MNSKEIHTYLLTQGWEEHYNFKPYVKYFRYRVATQSGWEYFYLQRKGSYSYLCTDRRFFDWRQEFRKFPGVEVGGVGGQLILQSADMLDFQMGKGGTGDDIPEYFPLSFLSKDALKKAVALIAEKAHFLPNRIHEYSSETHRSESNALVIPDVTIADQVESTSPIPMNLLAATPSHPTLNIVADSQYYGEFVESSLLTDLDEIDLGTSEENDLTERLDNRLSRIGQGKFRKNTIATWGGEERCAVTGVAIREVLTASHIIPWSKDVVQRKRGCNGILLTAHLDRLFDRHLIGFGVSPEVNVFSLVVSPRLADRFVDLEPLGVTVHTALDLSTVNPSDRPGLETNLRAHLDLVLNNK